MQNNPSTSPSWDEFLRPLLELAAKEPIMRRTAVPVIADKFEFSDDIRNETLKGGQPKIQNRAGWAMSSLVKAQFIEKHLTEKFTYQITAKGLAYLSEHQGAITDTDLHALDGYKEAWQEARRRNQAKDKACLSNAPVSNSNHTPIEQIEAATESLEAELRKELLESLYSIDPFRFEQIVVDLLSAMGYGGSNADRARVTQKSNDEGIDGVINEDALGLDVIYIQAKRYQAGSNIGRKEIQSFVGALAGKQANKGVFITTSDFASTASGYAEAVPQKVILINGQRLADLMITHNIGVSTQRTISLKRLDSDYFENN